LLLREIAFLSQLFALKQALLDRERTLRPPAFRLLRLQLLHVLLQSIDPGLALGTAARQRVTLPLLRELLVLLKPLFTRLFPRRRGLRDPFLPLLLPFLPRRTRARGGRAARAP
jgi:hypothetical protein